MSQTEEKSGVVHGDGATIKRVKPIVLLGILAVVAGVGLLSWNYLRPVPPEALGAISEEILMNVPADQVPEGALYITQSRRGYDGGMYLIIPALKMHTQIGADTGEEGLTKMPGLYEFSQMPTEVGGNVSIAGHRDIHGKEFYYLHNLQKGDWLYLVYENNVYKYQYHESKVVTADNWDVIRRQGYTALTLTTCDPIGTSLNRLIITGMLVDIQPYSEQFYFEIRSRNIGR